VRLAVLPPARTPRTQSRSRPQIDELVEAGELRPVKVETWSEKAFLYQDARLPGRIEAASLLSPFEPVV
jgi:uncharacterized protein YcaQ